MPSTWLVRLGWEHEMLMRLLHLIRRGGIQQPGDLAAELGVSPGLVEMMLADLERLGYLEPMGAVCTPTACAHCSAASASCLVRTPGGGRRGWRLTSKAA